MTPAHAFPRPAASDPPSVSLLDQIGNTPLVRLTRLAEDFPGVEIYVKLEYHNPGGSVKDRPALNMILDGERTGKLAPGRIILDSTSGNTGIAYAMIAAVKGYHCKLCLPANASEERKKILSLYGAELVLTDPGEGSDGAIRAVRKIYESDPDLYFYPDQYNNPANWKAHYASTGPEILHQTQGRITHFVAIMGTSGTFIGVSRRLKHEHPEIQCISAQPSSGFHGIEGTKHMPTAIVPGIYDDSVADENVWVDTEDSYGMARRLAREEGLLVGISAAANVHAARAVAKRLAAEGRKGVIVTIACDSASKYLGDSFWNAEDR